MPKAKPRLTVIHRGRKREISPEVRYWSRLRRRFKEYKPKLLVLLASKGWDNAKIQAWLNTPLPELRNRSPRQMITPKAIVKLYDYARRVV